MPTKASDLETSFMLLSTIQSMKNEMQNSSPYLWKIADKDTKKEKFCKDFNKQLRKVLWTWKGVRTTVVTPGHYTHTELTSGMLWLAVTAVACSPAVYVN